MRCQRCGMELSDDSIFCSYCGSKIEKIIDEKTEEMPEKSVEVKNDNPKVKKILTEGDEKKESRWCQVKKYGKIYTAVGTAVTIGMAFASPIVIKYLSEVLYKKPIIADEDDNWGPEIVKKIRKGEND